MVKDVDLFAAAMAGVKPLAGRKRPVRPKPAVIPRPKAEGPLEPRKESLAARRMAPSPDWRSTIRVSSRHLARAGPRQARAPGLARPARHDPGGRRARRRSFSRGGDGAGHAHRADRHGQGLAPARRSHDGRPHPRRIRRLAEPARQSRPGALGPAGAPAPRRRRRLLCVVAPPPSANRSSASLSSASSRSLRASPQR